MSDTQVEAADQATIKRAIKMSMFGTAKQTSAIKLAAAQLEADGKNPADAKPLTLGQIVGRIADVSVRQIVQTTGEVGELWSGVGEFEAMVYETGQVMESTTANLPRYYLEGVKALLDKGAGAVVCGIEIVLVATGKQIPVAYEVRNLVPREADNPLNRVKEQMAKAGKLRLPPPVAAAPLELAHDDGAPPASISDQARVDKASRTAA